ncbi:branched chain amino acid aminotransferase [Mangrovactinospora gilvigrisea]|uniref:Branched-chain-amino-acid aminotransferase n=1 Tax=Mangrovactinospora gilvigrisea TaxID=1428644 RepID=A0A1J7CD76_9ACTN|nr:branched-chain amino acid aminotransferase [Mangrovactinospora gilvigrisea]OIV37626.1 branched chain amino acid aminotransferase [Mangrovactinospora gilvigrisea]
MTDSAATTAADLEIALRPTADPLPEAERQAILADPGFGRYFTDHMVSIEWSRDRGWHDAQLVPYGPMQIDPANMAIHYGQSIFEGLKAYRQPDGSVATFRPYSNARRFRHSATRLAMPELPEELFVAAVEALVRQDAAWVPTEDEQSLYLRPFMFATENGLGVKPADEYRFLLIASPAGAYFSGGIKPVSVWLSEDYVRAAPGGTGEAKCAGNYAASLIAQAQAAEKGCDQVVWLDAHEHRWIEEMGGMNLYFVQGEGANARILTPELSGSLLAGITRDSLLQLAADLGYTVEEAKISVDDWREGNADGSLSEVFACGTAAVITPVGDVKSRHADWTVGGGEAGAVTMRLRKALLDIQTGAAPDPHNWRHPIA